MLHGNQPEEKGKEFNEGKHATGQKGHKNNGGQERDQEKDEHKRIKGGKIKIHSY